MISFILDFYHRRLSPLLHALLTPFAAHPKTCRFTPTCSQYTKKAIKKYGIIQGLVLGTKRILRCNPLFKGGHHPLS